MTPGARPVGVLLSAMLVTAAVLTGGGPRAAALPDGAGAALPGGQRVPEPGSASELDGVFCTSSASCWAVGGYSPPAGNIELNEALRWNGRTWSQVFVPSPPGSMGGGGSVLREVRCLSAANCWAVGLQVRRETELNEALHWNGRKWSLIPVPQPGGTVSGDSSQLFDVACGSPASCWAAGDFHTGATITSASLNELLHWNGRRWSLVSVPDPGGAATDDRNVLESVRCASARSCLAVIPHQHRAAVMSAFYVVAYASLSLPAVLAGLVVTHLGLHVTFETFGSIVAVVAVAMAIEAWRTRPGRRRARVRG